MICELCGSSLNVKSAKIDGEMMDACLGCRTEIGNPWKKLRYLEKNRLLWLVMVLLFSVVGSPIIYDEMMTVVRVDPYPIIGRMISVVLLWVIMFLGVHVAYAVIILCERFYRWLQGEDLIEG